jgi:energy-coupling factor transport system permease protein
MSRELLASPHHRKGLVLDPRTKLALLLTIALFILSDSYQSVMQYVLASVPLILLLAAKMWKSALFYALMFSGSFCLELFALPHLSGLWGYLTVASIGIVLHFGPSFVMAYFVLTTTTVSELVAAMERMHMPRQITIPLSVMFRFFPTVMEEWGSIGDAMRMRGIRWGGGKVGALLEYRLVPMMMCSVKIGEELNTASLTRGLGGPVKRTNICEIGFRPQDIVLLLTCLGVFIARISTQLGM